MHANLRSSDRGLEAVLCVLNTDGEQPWPHVFAHKLVGLHPRRQYPAYLEILVHTAVHVQGSQSCLQCSFSSLKEHPMEPVESRYSKGVIFNHNDYKFSTYNNARLGCISTVLMVNMFRDNTLESDS